MSIDTPTAEGATNVLLNQRSLTPPYLRQAVGIQGDENPGRAIGFDANGVLGALPGYTYGAAGSIVIASGGTNQDITLECSGTGAVKIPNTNGSLSIGICAPWLPAEVGQPAEVNNLIISNGGTLITRLKSPATNPVNPVSSTGQNNGIQNTFVGVCAGMANTTGNLNTFIGDSTGRACINGDQNVFVGAEAGRNTTNGYMNTFIGSNAGLHNTDGYLNTYVGCDAGIGMTTGHENVVVGAGAGGFTATGSYNVILGKAAGGAMTTGANNVAVGFGALSSATTAGENTATGDSALKYTTTGQYNTAGGSVALEHNTTGEYNVALGRQALQSNTTGGSNIAIGAAALKSNTNASSNVAVGDSALYACTNGQKNTAIGAASLYNLVTGGDNVALGHRAGFHEVGSNTFYVDNQDRGSYAAGRAGSLLFGTFDATPASQTLVANVGTLSSIGNFEATTVGKGFVLKSPDGTRYRIAVANGGALSTTASV